MREVSRRVRAAAAERGHEILLSVRLPADPQDALDMGMDAAAWAREGLVQWVIPAPRWRTCDSDIPVGMWKRLLAGTGAQLAPGIELLMQPGRCPRKYTTPEQVTALAHQHFSLGGDKTYLFNYFDDPIPEDTYWSHPSVSHDHMAAAWERQKRLLCILGDPELTALEERRHVITERDLRPAFRTGGGVLPFTCRNPGRYKTVRAAVGTIAAGDTVEVTLGLSEGAVEDVELYADCRHALLIGAVELVPACDNVSAYVFRLRSEGKLPPYLVLEMTTTGAPFTVEYIDIHIRPALR